MKDRRIVGGNRGFKNRRGKPSAAAEFSAFTFRRRKNCAEFRNDREDKEHGSGNRQNGCPCPSPPTAHAAQCVREEIEGAPKLTVEKIRSVAICSSLTTGCRKLCDADCSHYACRHRRRSTGVVMCTTDGIDLQVE